MLTLILVVIFTVRERCGGILDLFGLPGYGHYDDPERHIHHAFPASEAIVSPTNVAHRSNNTIRNGGVNSNLGSGGFRCGCGCGCGCDATGVIPVGTGIGTVGAVPNSDTDSDSHSSESNTDGEYYSDIGDLFSESDSSSDDDNNNNDGNNSDGNVGSDYNGDNDDDNTGNDINININGIIDYNDGTISYGIIRDALNGQNNGGTDNDTEAVNNSRFGNAFVSGNNGLLADMYLGLGDVDDDNAVIGIFDYVRDIYDRTGDVCEDGNYAGDMDRMCTDPFSEQYY